MKKKIASIIIAFFTMVLSCAVAFADTVTFDKKNKGNEKDFVTMEFNSVEELAALCKKYKKNNAEVLIKAGSPFANMSGLGKPELFKIIECFPGADTSLIDPWKLQSSGIKMSVSLSGITIKDDMLLEFKYEGKQYSLARISGVEASTVSFLKLQLNAKDFNNENTIVNKMLSALNKQQKVEFNSVKEFEPLFKNHTTDSFYIKIPVNSKIRKAKELEKFFKLVSGVYSGNMNKFISYFQSDSAVIIESYICDWMPQSVVDATIGISSVASSSNVYRITYVFTEEESSILQYQEALLESERSTNDESGFGRLTNEEVEKERKANDAAGRGHFTNTEILNAERTSNEKAGFGKLTNAEVEKERKQNETKGYGRITNAELTKKLDEERKSNEKSGLGKLTNAEVEKERNQNDVAGRGRITNKQVAEEQAANEKAGLGKLTNAEVEKERKANESAGRGRLTNAEIEVSNLISKGFILVEGGTFQMGSNDGDDDEKPVHSVTVSSFYMCDHEVTQKEYYDIMKNYPSLFNGDDRPVENVSWYDAIEYCNKKSIAEGLMPCYTIDKNRKDSNNNHPADKLKWTVTCNFRANGYRLPTEAEWEYAARGGIKSKGYKYSGSNILENVVWMKDETYDVKNTSPNELGIYDMTGNVGEWCWDWYGPYEISVQINPAGTPSGVFRVFRGGTWNDKDEACLYLVAHRSRLIGEWTFIGFRVVRSCIN